MSGWREGGPELDSEQGGALDRALDALRVAAAPVGLEERVLRGVQARVAQGEVRRRGAWWGAALWSRGDWSHRGWVVGGFVTAAVAVLLVVVGVREDRRPGLVERANAPAVKVLRHGVVGRVGVGDTSGSAVVEETRAALAVERAAGVRVVGRGVRPEVAGRGGARPTDARMAAVWVGGMPAPPMPLTEQERLLLEVVRGRNAAGTSVGNAAGQAAVKAAAVEMLDRGRQDEELARNDAEFLKFFPPPPPVPPPGAADGDGAGKAEKVNDAGQAVQQDAEQGSNQVENSGGKR